MSVMRFIGRVCLYLCLAAAVLEAGVAQERPPAGGPLTGPATLNAPFIADATTTVRQILKDGTKMDRRAVARYYRDLAGRVRVEQIVMDSGKVRTTISDDPVSQIVHTRDETTLAMVASPRPFADWAIGGGDTFVLPLSDLRFLTFYRVLARDRTASDQPIESELLGSRRIGGVQAIGSRVTLTVFDTYPGHGRRIEIVDERWESSELNLVLESRYTDPRTAVIEYQLTNIVRAEPPSDLFEISADAAPKPFPSKKLMMRLLTSNPSNGLPE